MNTHPIELFYSYADIDESLCIELDNHLSLLRHEDIITAFHKRHIKAGTDLTKVLDEHLNTASVILLLISSDFLASNYCYGVEMRRAMELHERGATRVIPILLRPVGNWQGTQFGKLKTLPSNGKAVTSWPNRDAAFVDIEEGIRTALQEVMEDPSMSPEVISQPPEDTRMATLPPADSQNNEPQAPSSGEKPSRRAVVIAGLAASLTALGGGAIWWITRPRSTCVPSPPPPLRPIDSKGLLTPGVLSWGADPSTGGAPYVFRDANKHLIGFEVDIANAIAGRMGILQDCHPTKYKWDIENDLRARRMDIILNGWEVTSGRELDQSFSTPYYHYNQQLVVRVNDSRFSQYTTSSQITLPEIKDYKFGTGEVYKAADLLRDAGIKPLPSAVPLDDLDRGTVDIVLIDSPIVIYYVEGKGLGATPSRTLRAIGKPMFADSESSYVIGFRKGDSEILREEINQALLALKQDGTLSNIYRRWELWNDSQEEVGIRDSCA
jgi:ABC-type amino acid transport substrate-binding protein